MNEVNVGIIGAGTVGCGVVKILLENYGLIQKRSGVKVNIKKIADIDINRKRPVRIPKRLFTTDSLSVINDPDLPVIIELVGGTTIAKDFVMGSIKNKKHVVTANKALLAHHGSEIFSAAAKHNVNVGFEASVGGAIPIIISTKESYVPNNIRSIYGIMNGTCNYILSTMTEKGLDFDAVLNDAQEKGYAEADPSFDIDGIDAAHKLSILIMLSYGQFFRFNKFYVEGIRNISKLDISYSAELGYVIKLLAIAKAKANGIEAGVYPALVKKGTQMADVSGAFNAIYMVGDALGPTMLYGMGAGMMPTASAVVGDIVQIAKSINSGSSDSTVPRFYKDNNHTRLLPVSEKTGSYYLRFQVKDKPGVLGKITNVLGDNKISIESVIQKGNEPGGDVQVVMMTHEAREHDLKSALKKINRFGFVNNRSNFIRIENLN
ncbi:MAG: homoserine dehydrogenase [Candidatus Dadabacteria bacterium]|nr:homoserine dehydrogenase [Candidatus Dadabacteria bacterium]NIX15678.1 homoserine dehydrogenase [Candidatus Dadabacteria bacterium]NIY22220.1 homoserine dehydrogenase [Candidatus Dadabacteria bacterium]